MKTQTKFYNFLQNNSGGSFIVDDKVCHRLFIEAKNPKEANLIAETLGVYFDGCRDGIDCDCCGDRWYEADSFEEVNLEKLSLGYKQTFKTVEDYAQYLANDFGWTTPDVRIFYLSGEVVEINSGQ